MRMSGVFLTVLLGLLGGCSSAPDKFDNFKAAQLAFHENDFESAVRFLDRELKTHPDSEEAFLLKVKALSRQGEFSLAHEILHSRISTRPHSTFLNLALVDWHLEFGSRKAALEVAQKIIRRNPFELAAHRKIIDLALEFEDWKLLENSLRVVHSLDPLDGNSAILLGKHFLKSSKFEEALAVFLPLTKAPEFRAEAGKYAAWIYAERGMAKEANKFLQELSISESEDPFVRKIITRNLLNSSDVNRITVLTSYVKQTPDEWGNHQLYLELLKAGLKEDALNHLANVWNKFPESRWAAINYSHHLAASGDLEIARNILRKASEGAPARDKQLINQSLADLDKGKFKETNRSVATTGLRVHQVKSGETLQTISMKYFGTVKRWNDIWELNRLSISESGKIAEGLTLQIPQGVR